jgi:hypothetical protein
MDAKELSAFLSPPKITARETLLGLTGGAIALLLVAAGTSFYKRDYRDGLLCFLVATLLGFVFFRKRKVALVVSGLSCILALGGLGFPFHHPSFSGLVLLLGSAAAVYLTIRWQCEKYPYLSFKHVHTLFEGEEAMAAENARIEAEARELAKKRPGGPWLFR